MKLGGERVCLRPWGKRDAARLAELCNDREIFSFTTVPRPYAKKNALQFIRKVQAAGKKGKESAFAIALKETGEVIGSITAKNISKRDVSCVIGFFLGRKFRGRGYMAEALRVMLEFCFRKLKLNRVEISCAAENRKSKRVIEGAGAKFEGRLRQKHFTGGKFRDMLVYSILKNEFKP